VSVGIAGIEHAEWQAALAAASHDGTANGFNSRFPANRGELDIAVPIVGLASGAELRVALAHDGERVYERAIRVP
jgi:hypothetical protein